MYVGSYELYQKIIRKPYKIYHFMDKKTQRHKDVKSSSKPSAVIASCYQALTLCMTLF